MRAQCGPPGSGGAEAGTRPAEIQEHIAHARPPEPGGPHSAGHTRRATLGGRPIS
jgi:hypothetical protein